jgi:hypothetical protein
MSVNVELDSDPFWNFTYLLCGMVFCHDCRAELFYKSDLPEDSEERWYDQAQVMRQLGWVLRLRAFAAFCPECARRRNFSMTNGDAT